MSTGWIKVHRKLVDNPIFKNPKLLTVFMYCVLKASHKDHQQLLGDTIVDLKEGQLATGRQALASATGLTIQNVRTALNKLESLGIITIKPTNKYSVITVLAWTEYQNDNQQTNQQVTSKSPASNQQVTTNKNVKNVKNDNNICQQVADAFNESLGDYLGRVKVLNDKRKRDIKSCIKEFANTQSDFSKVETWNNLFRYIEQSDFLMGRTENGWSANFDFIINKTKLIKIVEGQYENNTRTTA